jgi:hypothetical protein
MQRARFVDGCANFATYHSDGSKTIEKGYFFMAQPFGRDIPRLSWLGAKTFAQHASSRKNKSGNAPEHAEANKMNLSSGAWLNGYSADALAKETHQQP